MSSIVPVSLVFCVLGGATLAGTMLALGYGWTIAYLTYVFAGQLFLLAGTGTKFLRHGGN